MDALDQTAEGSGEVDARNGGAGSRGSHGIICSANAGRGDIRVYCFPLSRIRAKRILKGFFRRDGIMPLAG